MDSEHFNNMLLNAREQGSFLLINAHNSLDIRYKPRSHVFPSVEERLRLPVRA